MSESGRELDRMFMQDHWRVFNLSGPSVHGLGQENFLG
jgi:hypothetical protein